MGFSRKPANPSEVIGCTEETTGVVRSCVRNNTIIEFRPIRTYNGEFGFDWLRVDDSPVLPQVVNEPPYKDCILGSHKSGYTKATPNPAAYNDLKTEYQKLNVTNHRAAPKNEYFIPWLNLYSEITSNAINTQYMNANSGTSLPVKPPYQADLRMIADIQGDKPYKIELEFNAEFLSISAGASSSSSASPSPFLIPNISSLVPDIGNQEVSGTIRIKCLKDFATDQYVTAWAYQYIYTEAERKGFESENKTLEQNNSTLETENQKLSEQQKSIEAERKTAEEEVAKTVEAIQGIDQQINQLNSEAQQRLAAETDALKRAEITASLATALAPLNTQKQAQEVILAERNNKLKEITDRLNANLTTQADNNKQLEENTGKVEENKQKIAEENKSLAGKLCVCPNDEKTRKTVKILMIDVITNFSTTSPPSSSMSKKGVPRTGEEEGLYRALYQALVSPEITKNITFDRSNDIKFKMDTATTTGFVNASGIIKYGTITDCFRHLKKEFYDENKLLYKERENYPLFFFELDGEGMGGVALRGDKVGAMFDNRPADTVPHEGLHGLGLHHTHMDYNKSAAGVYTTAHYTSLPSSFKYVYFMARPATHPDANFDCSTSNFMSYKTTSSTATNTNMIWRWQWQVIRNNL